MDVLLRNLKAVFTLLSQNPTISQVEAALLKKQQGQGDHPGHAAA